MKREMKKLKLKMTTVSQLNQQQMKVFIGGMADTNETEGCGDDTAACNSNDCSNGCNQCPEESDNCTQPHDKQSKVTFHP